jgi:hypothetical protein
MNEPSEGDRNEESPDDTTRDRTEVNDMAATMHDDDALLAALGEALAAARRPDQERLIADAQEAFSFLSIQDELAALTFDSLWEDKLESATRSLADVRTLVFDSAELSLEIEISGDGFVGQVTPPTPALIEVERPDGSRTEIETDALGSFTLVARGSGPVRFRVSRGTEVTVTDWINIAGS